MANRAYFGLRKLLTSGRVTKRTKVFFKKPHKNDPYILIRNMHDDKK